MAIRAAAASARELLTEMAASQWNTPADQIVLENGVLTGGGKRIDVKVLLKGKQLTEAVRQPKKILGKSVRKIVGKPIGRDEIEAIVRGAPHFVHDLDFPGILHARVVRPPSYAARIERIDQHNINKLAGLVKLVRRAHFVAVLAEDEYRAIQLAKEVGEFITWTAPAQLPQQAQLQSYLKSLPAETSVEKQSNGWKNELKTSGELYHEANYFKPYLMHGANGPSCGVALYKNGELWVWSHTQGVYPLRKSLAGLLHLNEDKIHVKGVQGPGCYGHNGADDAGAEAAIIAMEHPGQHIRLQWMRQEEHSWEPFSTAMIMELKASLDNNKRINAWQYELWSDVHGTRPGGNPDNLLASQYLTNGEPKPMTGFKGGAIRNAEPYYELAQQKIVSHIFTGPLRRSTLRGLGAYANIFAIESFMDELAEKAKLDAIQFRISHSTDPRSIACLEQITRLTADTKPGKNQGIGYAFSRYKNSAAYCAVAALVTSDPKLEKLTVEQMWAVVDAGETINPDGLKNQIEGGMMQSISWALYEEVGFDQVHITSSDWRTYPMIRFPQAPRITVHVIDRVEEDPLGAGEASQGPTTAALINAIYAASGQRIRSLPVFGKQKKA